MVTLFKIVFLTSAQSSHGKCGHVHCVALASFKSSLKRSINGQRGVKGAHFRPQVYQLSRVFDVKYGRFTFFNLFIKPWGRGCKTCHSRNF